MILDQHRTGVSQDRRAPRRTLSPEQLRERGIYVPGIIVRRGGSYALKIYAGRENGKKRDKWLTFQTEAEAKAAQRELASHVLAHSAGLGLYGSPRERLGRYLTDWLARQRSRLAPRTAERYETFATQVQRDAVGTLPLARLSPRALESYYTRRLDSGLSPTTVNHQHRMLHKALGDAVRQDLIVQNPAATAQAPKRAQTRPEVWSESQTLLFLSEAKATSAYYPVYAFIVATGVRVGEALGIAWEDIDLRESIARVDQTLQRIRGGGYVLKDPKSVRSVRPVLLSPETVEVLQDLQAGQGERRRGLPRCERGVSCTDQACRHWHEVGLVFTQPNGKPLHPNNIRQRDLRRFCTQLGLPFHRALHNLRHAHGTYLLHRGVSLKVIQERLGHASAQFTLNTYAHVLTGMQESAARAVSAMLKGGSER